MLLDARCARSMVADPLPGEGQVLVKVGACGLCRTDLHVVDGELTHPKLPLVPGHQIVGAVVEAGAGVETPARRRSGRHPLARLDVRGVRSTARAGRENLCDQRAFHRLRHRRRLRRVRGRRRAILLSDRPLVQRRRGGAAALRRADRLPRRSHAAGDGERLGLYGFGASAHIVAQVARYQGRRVFAVTRPRRYGRQEFARHLGADWAGGTGPDASRGARRGDHLRAGRRARPARTRCCRARVAPSCAPAST